MMVSDVILEAVAEDIKHLFTDAGLVDPDAEDYSWQAARQMFETLSGFNIFNNFETEW